MESTSHPRAWKVLLAFAIIYFVWGSTFLAIRVGVREVPPFLLAGMRFLIAGAVLYAGMRIKGTSSPTAREWTSATLLAVLIFVFDYGLLFWAVSAVMTGFEVRGFWTGVLGALVYSVLTGLLWLLVQRRG